MTNIQEILLEILEVQEELDTNSIRSMINYVNILLDSERRSIAIIKRNRLKFSKFTKIEQQLIEKWLTELDVFAFETPGLYSRYNHYSFEDLENLELIRLSRDKKMFLDVHSTLEGKLIVPSSVKGLGYAAFEYSNLSEVILPDSIAIIPEDCFSYCRELKKVRLGGNVRTIGASAFAHSGIEEINIPKDSYVSAQAFRDCKNLKRELVPSSCEV